MNTEVKWSAGSTNGNFQTGLQLARAMSNIVSFGLGNGNDF